MNERDFQLGGGYTYQWQAAILLALNYFGEPVAYDEALHGLVGDFLEEKVDAVYLEGTTGEGGIELEDIALEGGPRRILIQVKTKQARAGQWRPSDSLLLKALVRFCASPLLDEEPENTRFVFLTNRAFNQKLEDIRSQTAARVLAAEPLDETEELENLVDALIRYAGKKKVDLDASRCRAMLARTLFVKYLDEQTVKANVQAKLQAFGKRDWAAAYNALFERIADLSTRKGGSRVTLESIEEAVGGLRLLGDRFEEALIDPGRVFERVQIDRVVRRPRIESQLDRFLEENERGYFIVEANAGLGKTSFLAHLVEHREYLHHFCELARGQNGYRRSLANLAAQLGRAWDLDVEILDDLEFESVPEGFVGDLLKKAAAARDGTRPDARIVLVIDGLDESWAPANQNHLGLPFELPPGVFLVVSKRPSIGLKVGKPRRVVTIRPADNQDDILEYLDQAVTWPGVQEALRRAERVGEAAVEQFQRSLEAKAGGSWIYLHYVVREIEEGLRSPDALEDLPDGLWQYYADIWMRARDADEASWYDARLPLLGTLAVLQEEAALEDLCGFAGVEATAEARRTLDGDWRPYLAISEPRGEPPTYRLYHDSLRGFLSRGEGAEEDAALDGVQRSFVRELENATLEAHRRLAESALGRWGGLEAGLPGLRDTSPEGRADRYALRHLVAHLHGAGRHDGRYERLHRLLSVEWPAAAGEGPEAGRVNAWFAARDRAGDVEGYLGDLERALQLTRARVGNEPTGSAPTLYFRYSLIRASIRSLALGAPPLLLGALVEAGIWSGKKAVSYAERIGDPERRNVGLIALLPHLPEASRARVKQAVLDEVRALPQPESRAHLLFELAGQLSGDLREEVEKEALQSIESRPNALRIETLRRHAGRIPTELLTRMLQETAKDDIARVAELARHVPATLRGSKVGAALAKVEEIGDYGALFTPAPREQAEALASLAPCLSDAQLQTAWGIARGFQETDDFDVWGEQDNRAHALALCALAPYGPVGDRERAASEALERTEAIGDAETRVRAVELLAAVESPALAARLLSLASSMEDPPLRLRALRALVPHLPDGQRREALREAIAALDGVRDLEERAAAILDLDGWLARPQRERLLRDALASAWRIGDRERCRDAIDRLAGADPGSREVKAEAWTDARVKAAFEKLGPLESLEKLGDRMPEGLVRRAFRGVLENGDNENLVCSGLRLSAPYLPRDLWEEAEEAAIRIEQPYYRARALAGIAEHRPAEDRDRILRRAWARAFGDEGSQRGPEAFGITELVPVLPEDLLDQVTEAVARVSDDDDRAKILAALVPRLTGPSLESAVRDLFLSASKAIRGARNNDMINRALRALSTVAGSLPDELVERAWDDIRSALADEYLWDKTLALDLLGRLGGRLSARKIEATATELLDELGGDKPLTAARILCGLHPHLPSESRASALEAVFATAGRSRSLPPWLSAALPVESDEGVSRWFRLAVEAPERADDDTGDSLVALAPFLSSGQLREAIGRALRLTAPARAKALAGLAGQATDRLSRPELGEVWIEVLDRASRETRQDLLEVVVSGVEIADALGGPGARAELAATVRDICELWP